MTDARVAALTMPPGKTDHYEWDDARELAVRLRKRGPKSKLTRKWYKGGTVGGRWKPILIGDVRQIKAAAAYGVAGHISAQIALGEDPTAKRKKARDDAKARAKAQELRLSAMIKRYLVKKEKEVREGTLREAKYYLEKLWLPLHNEPITDIKRADVALVLEDIASKRGRTSARLARSNLNSLYIWAIGAGLCEMNPAMGTINPAKGIEARERTLSDAELKMLWPHLRPLFKLLLLTGCRREELGDLASHEGNRGASPPLRGLF